MRISLILGAGASLANALYFHGQKMPATRPPLDSTFFETVEKLRFSLSPNLRTYFTTVMRVNPTPPVLRGLRMEEVFKDVFFDFQDDPNNQVAVDAYIDLVDLYLRVLRSTTNWLAEDSRKGAPIGRLIAHAARAADAVDILTFNHDLVIENEIQRRVQLRGRWCLDTGYGTFGSSLSLTSPSGNPATFTRHADGTCDHSRPLHVLKLHGSLNWALRINSSRPTARFMSGETNTTPRLLLQRRITDRTLLVRAGSGRTQWQTWPLVVPPVYAKQALRQRLNDVWQDARTALESADRVVIFGYSLPMIDVEAEKMIERALASNGSLRWLEVIDPAPETASRYASLATSSFPIRWYPSLPAYLDAQS